MRQLNWIPVVFALVSASCSASYPTAPDPAIIALQVFYNRPMSEALTGSSYSFTAYAIRSDGAYINVTSAATWLSTDPQALRPFRTAGSFVAVLPGHADVAARYQGMYAALSIRVVPADRLTYPRLDVEGGSPGMAGRTEPIFLYLQGSPSSRELVAGSVTWVSADPSVARVEGTMVTGVQAGTTILRTTYDGLTLEYALSVHPSR
jgi:hypothetical protein